ncbi:hypothetical protein VCAG7404_000935B, partial [Vibrio cholerae O1 str. AG-7404]
FSILKRLN